MRLKIARYAFLALRAPFSVPFAFLEVSVYVAGIVLEFVGSSMKDIADSIRDGLSNVNRPVERFFAIRIGGAKTRHDWER